jgi:FlaA1/EpsC-like NDP-sugar epimerase
MTQPTPTPPEAEEIDLRSRTVLITGGTGSFGNRVASHLLRHGVKRVRVFSRDESKQWMMSHRFPDFEYVVGDVRDPQAVARAMQNVDIVFHAAALKQVPSCETFPLEAVKTNVLGSQNVCEAAIRAGVERVVALSTDKAVKPVNAMGMSKALMEKIVCSQNLAPLDTRFAIVRYGNVVGTRGSVIPLFRSQIAREVPITLTVPSMTRFLLSLDQAIGMVLYAMTRAKGGEIFVRKAPACTVADLAKTICVRHAKEGADYPTQVIGMRPGEKLHEVLVNEFEMTRTTDDGEFFTVHPEFRRPESPVKPPAGERRGVHEYTSENTERISSPEAIGSYIDRAAKEGEDYL